MTKFEKNGGYFIDGVAYMDCKITGEPVKNVSTDCKEVIGSRALTGLLHKKFPENLLNFPEISGNRALHAAISPKICKFQIFRDPKRA